MDKLAKKDHQRFDIVPHPHTPGGKSIKFTTPQDILRIHSREELEAQLKHYGKPFIKQLLPDSQYARKRYVEYMRPALRYYCRQFNVEVPGWLSTDDYFHRLPHDEKMDLFGSTKLDIKEYTQVKKFQGTSHVGGSPVPPPNKAQG